MTGTKKRPHPYEMDQRGIPLAEETMLLNMGQLLSIPFVIAGVWLVIRALSRPRVPIKFAKEKKK